MAQWAGQFSGFTHETKVQDTEISLRQAVETLRALPEAERAAKKMRAIRHLAERLLAVRLKALRARISALTEPGSKRLDDQRASHLRARERELQEQGIDDILREFGVYEKPVSAPWATSRSAFGPPMSVRTQPGHMEFTATAPRNSAARMPVTAFRAALEMR